MNCGKGSNNAEYVRRHTSNGISKEIMLKVLIVGDYGVGKTAIIRRYTEGKFSSNYKITIGADFSIKTIAWDTSTQINMQLWDIAGHEKIGFMTRVYYKYAAAAVIVFDVSRVATFQSIQKWLLDIRDKVSLTDGSPIPVIILANKCDIPDVSIPVDSLNKLCKQHNVVKWFKTSAKTNTNIDEAMTHLVSMALKSKIKETTQPNENIILCKNEVHEEHYTCCSEDVKDKILNCEDDSHLSKIHNNSRRLSIASELFISICSVYEYFVDCELTKIIDSLLQWRKYKYISKKITHKMQLELKREKYFEEEARSKLHKSLQDRENGTLEGPREMPTSPDRAEVVTKDAVTQEKTKSSKEQEFRAEAAEGPHIDEINVLGVTTEYSVRDEISNTFGNITEIRAESPADTSLLQFPNSHVEREITSFPTPVTEIPIRESTLPENAEDDINKILQILEGEIIEKEVDEMELLEPLLETTAKESAEKIISEKASTLNDQMDQSEGIEEWKLPSLEPTTKTKKHHHIIIDEITTIRNYSERALYLNSSIKIQRIQVFEGPPKVLQAISADHLMKSPGFKSSLFQDVRSSKLNRLFERHLKVEKKPFECITVPQKRPAEDMIETGLSKVRASEELVEDIGIRAGMYSLPGKSDVLADVTKEKSHLEDAETSKTTILQKENLVGVPMSRIMSLTSAPPEAEKINTASVLHTPTAQQVQGKSLDPETHSSWFHSTKENPPSAKYREFNYVHKKLQEYWSLFESQGMKKSITLREFFHFEVDGSVANFLTVLRILDKLSIKRKLLLKYQNQDVVIQPFEEPFVSEKQLQIREKEPLCDR